MQNSEHKEQRNIKKKLIRWISKFTTLALQKNLKEKMKRQATN